jgi:hypothetical protein
MHVRELVIDVAVLCVLGWRAGWEELGRVPASIPYEKCRIPKPTNYLNK